MKIYNLLSYTNISIDLKLSYLFIFTSSEKRNSLKVKKTQTDTS